MTTWYVRPDTSHNTTRDGTSYATAWGGWSEVVGGSMAGTDTLYVCGAHSYSAGISTMKPGTSPAARFTYRGDYAQDPGSITFTGSGNLTDNQPNVVIDGIRFIDGGTSATRCILHQGAGDDSTLQNCTFTGFATAIELAAGTGVHHANVAFLNNRFINQYGTQFQSAILWYVTITDAYSTINGCTVSGNEISGNEGTQAIHFRIETDADKDCKITNLVIADNIIRDGNGVAIRIGYDASVGDTIRDAAANLTATLADVLDHNSGLTITGNTIQRMAMNGTVGGAMVIRCFSNVLVSDNTISNVTGPYGACDIFYCTGPRIANNYIEDLWSNGIDGTAILLDHGNTKAVVTGNVAKRLYGADTHDKVSGCGVMLLDTTASYVSGNYFENVRVGMHIGDAGSHAGTVICGNTFICDKYGVAQAGAVSADDVSIRNNVFVAASASAIDWPSGGVDQSDEDYNCWRGFTAAGFHVFGAANISADPLLNPDGTLKPGSPCIGAGKTLDIPLLAYDGRPFANPPSIGAHEFRQDEAAVPRRRIDHTSAKFVRLDFTNGSVNVTPSGHPGGWPTLALQTAGVVSGGVLSIPSGTGGNRTTRVFADPYIDELMDLSGLPTAERYKCKFFATKIKRYLTLTNNTGNERIFQYGDQGSAPTQLNGGWVMRINATPIDGNIDAAIHMAYNPAVAKVGAQDSATHADPIANSADIADATWEAGVSLLMGVDFTVPGRAYVHLYVDAALSNSDYRDITSWAVPGKSTNGPGNDSSSNGFALFNQSTNQADSSLLHADVWPIWIGEARDQAHLAAIAAALHADPFTSPYTRS